MQGKPCNGFAFCAKGSRGSEAVRQMSYALFASVPSTVPSRFASRHAVTFLIRCRAHLPPSQAIRSDTGGAKDCNPSPSMCCGSLRIALLV
jgi:hypothetical protein